MTEAADEFLVNTTTIDAAAQSASGDGRAALRRGLAERRRRTAPSNGVFGRRFVIPLTLDVDGDGQVQPLTDGLLTPALRPSASAATR